MDFIQINKFSELHDGKNIIFCKTDFIFEEFKQINNIKNDVILITGNSDYPITDDHILKLPKNVKKWFAQNALSKDKILVPLPIGIENKIPSARIGHGIGYLDRMTEKERLLKREINKKPNKDIYSNFKIETNFSHRSVVKNLSIKSNYIDWEEPNLGLENFFDKIIDYRMIICPVGNGVDTHRIWEVLYSNRIPITIKIGDFKIYELYEKLPIIVLDQIDQLNDITYINNLYENINIKNYDNNILRYEYWKNKILNLL